MKESQMSDDEVKLISDENLSKPSSFKNILPIVLKWENLTFNINDDNKSIQILNGLSGFANPKQILAIMGSSGSGKTSFLSILSNQIIAQDNFQISGSVKLNDKEINSINSSLYLRFVPQESILFEFLTPSEFLKFNLSLETNLSNKKIKKRIENILELLQLTKVAHSLIGGTIVRGLSGGEKKRVCIANELIAHPSVLILDEPTSGLDSFIANSVINILKKITDNGVTVVLTIHQPSHCMFKAFDRLVLMQEGHFVYQGTADESIEYFNRLGFSVPKLINPPEYFMKLLKVDDRNRLTQDEEKRIKVLRKGYEDSENSLWDSSAQEIYSELITSDSLGNRSLHRSISFLFWRERLNYARNPLTLAIKILQVIFFSVINSLIFYDLGYDSQSIDNRKGSIVCFLFIAHFLPAFTLSMNLAYERHLILRELKRNLYGINSYLVMKILIEIPIMFITMLMLIFSTYYFVGLNHESIDKPFILFSISLAQYSQGIGIGLISGSISKSPIIANALGATVATCLMLFSGFFNDPETGPKITNWLRYCTPFYFLRNAALRNEFEDLDYNEDVNPEPKERYNYEGGILENIFISFIHFGLMYFGSYLVYRYTLYKINAGKFS